jgi:hypothetical protein
MLVQKGIMTATRSPFRTMALRRPSMNTASGSANTKHTTVVIAAQTTDRSSTVT